MKKIKKSISIVLALLMVLLILPVSNAAAYDDDEIIICSTGEPDRYLASQSITSKDLCETIDYDELKSYLIEAFASCPESVDITRFNVPTSKSSDLFGLIWNDIPELFNVRTAFDYGYKPSTKVITKLYPTRYVYSAEEAASRMSVCEKAGDKLLYDIEGNANLSETEKALLIHDRIAIYCSYATAELHANNLPDSAFTMDGVFVERSAVCNGYAIAFNYLARRAGLECYYCSSDALNHAWNIVYVDGAPYQLDSTWDDPAWDSIGYVSHDSFLLSTDAFKASPSDHNATDFVDTPTAATYDNAFWRNDVCSSFIYINGVYYYLYGTTRQSCLLKSTPAATLADPSDDVVLKNVSFSWNASASSVWRGSYTRLSTDGRNLYYNTPTAVYKYNIATGTATLFYQPQLDTGAYQYIYGSYYDGRYLTMDIANTPNYGSETYTGRVVVEMINDDCASDNHILKEISAATEATCTAAGATANSVCMICDAEIPSTVIPPVDHSYGEWTVSKEATCNTTGLKTRTCSVCGNTEDEIIATTEHIWSWVTDKEATCGTNGSKHEKCTNCNATRSLNTVIAATGEHSWTWVVDKAATCGENGSKHEKCTNCNATRSLNTVIAATGEHSWTWVVDKAATCGENGSKHEKCTNCNATRSLNTVIAATGDHTWTWVVDKAATCGENGSEHEKCSNCDATRNLNTVINATGKHSYGDAQIETEPTCSDEGAQIKVCTVCGDEVTEVLPKTAHVDENNDDFCDICDEEIDTSVDCTCICHKTSGLLGFFAKLARFFWRVFGTKPECVCGNPHY